MSEKILTIEERLVEQVKEILPTVLTDVELKQVIEKAIEKAFFTETRRGDRWNETVIPPLVVKIMEEQAKPMIEATIKDYIVNNKEKFKEVFESHLNKKFSELVICTMDHMFGLAMQSFRMEVTNMIENAKHQQ